MPVLLPSDSFSIQQRRFFPNNYFPKYRYNLDSVNCKEFKCRVKIFSNICTRKTTTYVYISTHILVFNIMNIKKRQALKYYVKCRMKINAEQTNFLLLASCLLAINSYYIPNTCLAMYQGLRLKWKNRHLLSPFRHCNLGTGRQYINNFSNCDKCHITKRCDVMIKGTIYIRKCREVLSE